MIPRRTPPASRPTPVLSVSSRTFPNPTDRDRPGPAVAHAGCGRLQRAGGLVPGSRAQLPGWPVSRARACARALAYARCYVAQCQGGGQRRCCVKPTSHSVDRTRTSAHTHKHTNTCTMLRQGPTGPGGPVAPNRIGSTGFRGRGLCSLPRSQHAQVGLAARFRRGISGARHVGVACTFRLLWQRWRRHRGWPAWAVDGHWRDCSGGGYVQCGGTGHPDDARSTCARWGGTPF